MGARPAPGLECQWGWGRGLLGPGEPGWRVDLREGERQEGPTAGETSRPQHHPPPQQSERVWSLGSGLCARTSSKSFPANSVPVDTPRHRGAQAPWSGWGSPTVGPDLLCLSRRSVAWEWGHCPGCPLERPLSVTWHSEGDHWPSALLSADTGEPYLQSHTGDSRWRHSTRLL